MKITALLSRPTVRWFILALGLVITLIAARYTFSIIGNDSRFSFIFPTVVLVAGLAVSLLLSGILRSRVTGTKGTKEKMAGQAEMKPDSKEEDAGGDDGADAGHRHTGEDIKTLLPKQLSIFENTIVGVALVKDGIISKCNQSFAIMFDYSRDEVVGMPLRLLYPSDEIFSVSDSENHALLKQDGYFISNTWLKRRTGTLFWTNSSVTTLNRDDPSIGAIWMVQDITEHRHAESMLRLRSRATESSSNGIVIADVTLPNNPIIYANPAMERITGYSVQEIIGRDASFLIENDPEQNGALEIRTALHERREGMAVLRISRKGDGGVGGMRWIELSLAPVKDGDDDITHFVGIVNDITERVQYEEQLEHRANHDALTGLANRNLFMDRLNQSILYAARQGHLVAVLLLDLDRFKTINDGLGHGSGDLLLKTVAGRLRSCLRETDTIARLGGDEFVIVLTELNDEKGIVPLAGKILERIARPINLPERELYITGSIGVSLYPKDGSESETLLKNADIAMYSAKDRGRNCFRFFRPEMNAHALTLLETETSLRRGLERGELRLYYQPKVDLISGLVVGAEALVRWQHPVKGLIAPMDFIPIAEETGLIYAIGEWVLQTACVHNVGWQNEGLAPITMAVNLSAHQFRQEQIVEIIAQVLEDTGMDPKYLELELTEGTVIQDPEKAVLILQRLKSLGVQLSLDDFGTGYSSLSYLTRFPIDQLKIDQSFVRNITGNIGGAAIAKAIIAMAHSLGRRVIAEGVETSGQLDYLRLHLCNEIQGFFFSHPLPPEEFAKILRNNKRLETAA